MRRFRPDAWIVHLPSSITPDFFGWWQRPKRYVLLGPSGRKRRAKALPRSLRPIYVFAHRRSLARADKLVAFHPPSARRLRSAGIAEDRLALIPAPATAWGWIPLCEEARRRLDLPADARIVLCVSRFSVRHDHGGGSAKTEMILRLLEAFARVRSDAQVVIVGDGPGRPSVEEAIASQGLADRVRLVGAVENKDVVWFYAACDLYAYPHSTDRCWLSVLEAQACGRPVVTMRTSSAEVTVADGRTGLLASDLDEFAQHLETLVRDRERCERMGRAAREYVETHHSLELRVKQIEDLILGGS
jgi:glycosyltransferase involved in cell wall biosynthesis